MNPPLNRLVDLRIAYITVDGYFTVAQSRVNEFRLNKQKQIRSRLAQV
jgi:hypothetical protein